jgi:WD40 repeat protein
MCSAAVSPDWHELATAGCDGTVRLWSADSGEPMGAPMIGHTEMVSGVAFSPDGKRLASASDDDTIRIWPATATAEMLCDKVTVNMNLTQWR